MNRCIVGDCLDELPTIDADSIDAVVTDPPYGIGFMGKKWDTFSPDRARASKAFAIGHGDKGRKDGINPNLRGRRQSPAMSSSQIEYDRSLSGQRGFQSWTEVWAREIMRVLKPGAHLLVHGAPRSFHRMTCGIEDAGFEIRDCLVWMFGQGFPKSHNGPWGGTALKPAWEPICVARKPLVGTVAENVLQFGCGTLNIDGCRIDRAVTSNPLVRNARGFQSGGLVQRETGAGTASFGRWPANLIHDGSDEVVACFPAEAGAVAPVHNRNGDKFRGTYGAFAGDVDEAGSTFQGDTGSAARFFYCAKASRTDRDEGCEALEKKPLLWSSGEQSPGTFQSPNTDRSARNNHPTVKPTALMRYLVRLVTPPGGTALDPFMGSGSTGKACALEGFDFIGIEREQEYATIAEARIAFAENLYRDSTAQQGMMFA